MGCLTVAACMAIAAVAAGNVLLVAHIFVLNDWSGGGLRPSRPEPKEWRVSKSGHPAGGFAYLSLALLLGAFGFRTLMIAAAIAGLSTLYSFHRIHMKGVPVLSSALHLAGGLLHFLLGHSAFRTPDW